MAATTVASAKVFNLSLPWIGLESPAWRVVSSSSHTPAQIFHGSFIDRHSLTFFVQLSDLYKKDHGLDPDPPRVGEKRLK